MEATTFHQIQSFPTVPHHNIVNPQTEQSMSGGPFSKVTNFYSTTSSENMTKETDSEEYSSGTITEAKNGNTEGTAENTTGDDSDPNIDIFISNVVCTFSVRCHLNLKKIGMEGVNVEYKREAGKVMMKTRKPNSTATIWSSGKITVTGNSSEADAKKSARRVARQLQKLGFRVHFHQFKVVNVLGTCRLPFAIRIAQFSEQHPKCASYEPEIHPAVTYKIKSPKATLKIFSTGSITVTAPSVDNVQNAIHHIYPLVEPHKMERVESKPEKRKQDILHVDSHLDSASEIDDEDEDWESEISDDDL